MDLVTLQTIIGHSDINTTTIYAGADRSKTLEMLKKAELSILAGAENTVHNPVHVVQNSVQIAAASNCKVSQEVKREIPENLCFCDNKPEKTKACDSMRDTGLSYLVGDTGLEPVTPCL
jgi:hypothetical protein